jgi:ABC-2 type transport system permease protein
VSHVFAIAARELRSYFVSPVAYVVLTLWAVLSGTFFLTNVVAFQMTIEQAAQFGAYDRLAEINLNDSLIAPFVGSMWVVQLFLLPAVTMGLFATERATGTIELLMTSPITIWEIVSGKFLAAVAFALLMIGIVGFFPFLLFFFGDPDLGKTAASLFGLFCVSVAYVAVGAFASSITRNQLIAFIGTMVLLLVIGMMLPFLVDLTVSGVPGEVASPVAAAVGWIATAPHFEEMLRGVIDTADLAYFAIITAAFLVLAKTAVESARWR